MPVYHLKEFTIIMWSWRIFFFSYIARFIPVMIISLFAHKLFLFWLYHFAPTKVNSIKAPLKRHARATWIFSSMFILTPGPVIQAFSLLECSLELLLWRCITLGKLSAHWHSYYTGSKSLAGTLYAGWPSNTASVTGGLVQLLSSPGLSHVPTKCSLSRGSGHGHVQ